MPLALELLAALGTPNGESMSRRSSTTARPAPAARAIARLLGAALLTAAALTAPARAETVYALRVRLHPDAAAPGTLPAALQSRLETRAGTALTLVDTTRTGALELALSAPRDAAEVRDVLRALRGDRAVLWAEAAVSHGAAQAMRQRNARPIDPIPGARSGRGSKLLVRLADGVAPDWDALLPRFSDAVGVPLAAERQIGNVWVLRLAQAQSPERLADLAARLQGDPRVRYADPVLRRYPRFLPNDPMLAKQWALFDPVGGVNISGAWDLQLVRPTLGTTVAVIDTGILPHEDLQDRVVAGYDFISDPGNARDGDGRDPNPRDEGDWMDEGACGGFSARPSSWHGTFVTGIIAANADNGVGIAGMDLLARIVAVRALGACGGSDEDVFEGLLWASGVQIAGTPPNPYPARVINMSLGGYGSCPNAVQEAIDDALAQGTVIVVAAGNETDDTSNYAPSGCSGVITVGASNRSGDRAFYSNFGGRVDISAPGGDGDFANWVLSLSNDGNTVPGGDAYAYEIGTSAAAPHVAGAVSMMLARNPLLTAGRVLSILQATARNFSAGSACASGTLCGLGILDAGLAVASTIPGDLAAPPGTVPIVEYYRFDLDHYYIADPAEAVAIDADPASPNTRTGLLFYAWADASLAPPGAVPVCKFYGSAAALIDSYFFTSSPGECSFVAASWPGTWTFVNPAAFWVLPANADGSCAAGTIAVYRFDNNRRDFNQRHTIDLSVKRGMINRAWVPDGAGTNGVAFCAPI
jgi:serine protease